MRLHKLYFQPAPAYRLHRKDYHYRREHQRHAPWLFPSGAIHCHPAGYSQLLKKKFIFAITHKPIPRTHPTPIPILTKKYSSSLEKAIPPPCKKLIACPKKNQINPTLILKAHTLILGKTTTTNQEIYFSLRSPFFMDASIPESIAVPITPPETVPITSETSGEYPFDSISLVK